MPALLKHILHDLFNRIYSNPSTLADIGIDHVRVEKALTAIASVWDTGLVSLSFLSQAGVTKSHDAKAGRGAPDEETQCTARGKGVSRTPAKTKAESEVMKQIYQQVTPTFAADDDRIWAEVDLLEGDPVHRGVVMRNPRF